jgi:hypothetical protein
MIIIYLSSKLIWHFFICALWKVIYLNREIIFRLIYCVVLVTDNVWDLPYVLGLAVAVVYWLLGKQCVGW